MNAVGHGTTQSSGVTAVQSLRSTQGSRNVNVYLGAGLSRRLEPYKERIKISEVCQQALLAAVDAEERAERGDRISRVIERLRRARSPREQAVDSGVDVGRAWAEDTAAMSELKSVARLRDTAQHLVAQPGSLTVHAGGAVSIEWTGWYGDPDQGPPDVELYQLPDSIPSDWFRTVAEGPFFDSSVMGFIRGASAVLDDVQQEIDRRARAAAVSVPEVHPDDIPF